LSLVLGSVGGGTGRIIIAAGGDDGVDSKARRSSALQPTPLSPALLVARVWPRPLRLNISS
jgi:hypothetical protein